MADRVEQFEVVAPAGTTRVTAVEIATPIDPGEIEEIEIVVPDGHAGLTGIALLLAHSQLVPITRGSFIVSNNEVIHWPMHNLPNSGAWSALVFNGDVFGHTFYLRFLVRELGSGIVLSEPIAPGQVAVIGVGAGTVLDTTDAGFVDTTPAPAVGPVDTTPPPDDTGDVSDTIPPPPDAEPVDTTPPPEDLAAPEPVDQVQAELPPADVEAPAPEPPAAPPPAPVIATYGLPGDYSSGAVPVFGNPGNIGMLIGTILGYKSAGGGANAGGSFNTWRFYSDLGNTADWNFYYAGAKRLQWVGPFNLRTGVPSG